MAPERSPNPSWESDASSVEQQSATPQDDAAAEPQVGASENKTLPYVEPGTASTSQHDVTSAAVTPVPATGETSDPDHTDQSAEHAATDLPHADGLLDTKVRDNTPTASLAPANPVAENRPLRYYDNVRMIEEDNVYRLDFIRTANSPPPTPSIRNLQLQIEDVERLVNVLFQSDKKRKDRFFRELHLTAFSGFVGDNYSVEVGLDNLQTVKNHIADAYPLIREPIWWANFWFLTVAAAACGIASAFHRYSTGLWLPAPDKPQQFWTGIAMAIFLIPLGCAAGLFIEFLFRVNDDIPYEQLRAINPGRWKPVFRAVNTVVVAFIFAALLADDIIQVGVSGTLLNGFKDGRLELSLAIGFVTGFAFPYVRDLLQQIRPERRKLAG